MELFSGTGMGSGWGSGGTAAKKVSGATIEIGAPENPDYCSKAVLTPRDVDLKPGI